MSAPNIVVYTAISRGYDPLTPVLPLWRGAARFVAFLEEPQPAPGWEILPLHREFRDPCRNAKIHKLLPHRYFPDADYSLWLDGAVALQSKLPLQEWPGEFLREHDLAVFKHRRRNCAYAEAELLMQGRCDTPEVIDRQMQKYYEAGYPLGHGLAECTVLFRRHSSKTQRFNEAWWEEIKAHSRRDQLSFNYVAHELGFEFRHFPGHLKHNPHFQWRRHTAPRSRPA